MLTRRNFNKSVAAGFLLVSIWRFGSASAHFGIGDDLPDDPDEGSDGDDTDDGNDVPEAPGPPNSNQEGTSGGMGDEDRSQVDLATGARSYDGPLSNQATSDPGQFIDSIFKGVFGLAKDERSELDGDLESGRLMAEATSTPSDEGRENENEIFSLDVNMSGYVSVGPIGGFYQSSPEGNSQSLGGYLGVGLGFWGSGTMTDNGAGTEFSGAFGVFIGYGGVAEVFVGIDTSKTLEIGAMVQGGAVEIGINMPALYDRAVTEYRDTQRNIENLYGLPRY
jgi:hypothetical protein